MSNKNVFHFRRHLWLKQVLSLQEARVVVVWSCSRLPSSFERGPGSARL